jgi:hypothetical protein
VEDKFEKVVDQQKKEPLIHEFNQEDSLKKSFTPKIWGLLIAVVVAGLVTGFLLSSKGGGSMGGKAGTTSNSASIQKGAVIGVNDTTSFKDTADGVVKVGGVNGEGAFHLERPGGESQNVYLTSSSVDLSKLIDRKIKVWGATQKAQYAGWLMDVGKVQVVE